ncbi:MAG: hypothetical protein L6437_04215 [Kiritimatiellae bacterium]|nr:hypothetical protein [Kiritimatiellia bacterium]
MEIVSKDGAWQGLGRVWIDGVLLRSADCPIAIRIDTPEGLVYTRLEIEKVSVSRKGAVAVRMRAVGYPWARSEYHDEYNQPMIHPGLPPEGVVDRVVLYLKPVTTSLAGREWHGFSYVVTYESKSRNIHRILILATWEIGGRSSATRCCIRDS